MRLSSFLVVLAAAVALAACGDARDVAAASSRECTVLSTGATCPAGSTLTYASFGQAFFGTYCTRCHSSALTDPFARNGASPGVNFDTLAGIKDHACRIDEFAGSGPNGTNRSMPFNLTLSPPLAFPSDGERAQLSQWLACGAP